MIQKTDIRYLLQLISVFLCFILSFNTFSQNQISFRQLSVKDGLSQNSAISIAQDSIGFLWIATQNGLNKYDGRKFVSYPFDFLDITRPDYSNLGKVYTDRKGEVWILPTDKIPHKLNRELDKFEPVTTLDDASVIFQDTQFNIWIGTYSSGLYKIASSESEPIEVLSSNQLNSPIFQIIEGSNSEIYLTTEEAIIQINILTNTVVHTVPQTVFGDPIEQNFSAMTFDESGRQWVGTYGNGLYYKEKNSTDFRRISALSFIDPLPFDLNILALHIDSKERLWIASYGSGLYLVDFKNTKITHFTVDKHNPNALHYNDILCIYEDYTGTLWFGSDGAGLSFYDEYLEKFNSFTNFQTPENISIDVIRAIAVDASNNVWLGTSGNGLTQYEPATNSWRTFNTNLGPENAISSNRIMSLLIDDQSDVWIGTQDGGLNILNSANTVKKYSTKSNPALSASTIWDIFKDSQNRTWLATRENGIIQFDKNKGVLKNFTIHDSLPSNNIRVITQRDANHLWLGFEEDGLALFDVENESATIYTAQFGENALTSNKIKSLYYDKASAILWIGTNGGGLNAFDTNTSQFYNFTTDDGLANNVIYAILPDTNGNFWLSSNKGITKFTQGETLADRPTTVNYDNYAGLATEFNTGAYFIDSNSNLYFGGLDGFYWFHPDNIKENNVLPKTAITNFEIFNKAQPLKEGAQLKYNENTISFSFSSLAYSLPEKNNYQYKLVNHEDNWVQAGNNNTVRYPQLPPGDYEFMVKSSNYDGAWNETPVTFKFSIAPPWYLTLFFKIIYGILAVVAILGFYSYLKWRWAMQLSLKLKKEEAERFKKLNDFKSKLYTDISHEFRTPLTLIAGPIDAKINEGNISDADFANFSMIKRNTSRLLSLVDQLLDLAKLDKGKLKLKVQKGDLDLFLQTIAASFDYKADQKKMDFKIAINSIKKVWYDEDIIEKITTNLLSNAFKYSPDNGTCEFLARQSDDSVIITFKNTVENLSEEDIETMFTRFYQKDEYKDGAGIGLSLVKELVELYNGKIEVKFEKNKINFEVILPVNKLSFKKSSIVKKTDKKPENPALFETIDSEIDFKSDTAKDDLPLLLIVDDHAEVRKFIGSVLKHRYHIFEAENGKQGIKKALELVPDLIVSDIRMPICNGIEMTNTLKTDERTSHIPIVLLTAKVGEENELVGLQSGADDFITKPFKIKILETKIANLIQTRKALRSRYSQELILKAKDIAITPTDEVFLTKVQKILDESLADPEFNAVVFSKKAGMSRMQLHRKLLAYTGHSTSSFIRSQRLKQAVHIIKTSDTTINEVAYSVGFNTPSYFIKCFKEVYKKTPSEYLQSIDK